MEFRLVDTGKGRKLKIASNKWEDEAVMKM